MNRLPFFTNHFFDTYLLISEDTPVGELVPEPVGARVAWGDVPFVSGKDLGG